MTREPAASAGKNKSEESDEKKEHIQESPAGESKQGESLEITRTASKSKQSDTQERHDQKPRTVSAPRNRRSSYFTLRVSSGFKHTDEPVD